MAPQIEPLAQSESKARFFQRLGLSQHQESDNRIYKLMKEEAIRGRERILSNPESLLPQLRNDPTIRPPYSNVQICETAIHREILRIHHEASPETAPWYQQGHDVEGYNEENWIIRWMLWHVFRFRDNRNKNRQTGRSQRRRSPESSDEGGAAREGTGYWDPVRDAQRTART